MIKRDLKVRLNLSPVDFPFRKFEPSFCYNFNQGGTKGCQWLIDFVLFLIVNCFDFEWRVVYAKQKKYNPCTQPRSFGVHSTRFLIETWFVSICSIARFKHWFNYYCLNLIIIEMCTLKSIAYVYVDISYCRHYSFCSIKYFVLVLKRQY